MLGWPLISYFNFPKTTAVKAMEMDTSPVLASMGHLLLIYRKTYAHYICVLLHLVLTSGKQQTSKLERHVGQHTAATKCHYCTY